MSGSPNGTTNKRNNTMKTMAQRLSVVAAMAFLGGASLSSATELTALMLFSCDADGNPAGNFVWDTRGSDSDFYKVWLTQGVPGGAPDGLTGPFINGPTWAMAPIRLPLSAGTNQFTVFFQHNGPWPAFALNLFFEGDSLPALSVKAPWRTSDVLPPFTANRAPRTYSLTSYPSPNAPAAGTASAVIADRRVEVTAYYVAATNVFNVGRVSSHAARSDGGLDYVGTFTLVVGPRRPTNNIKIDLHVTEVTICWESEAGSLYQVEYRSPGHDDTWTKLGQPVEGTGDKTCAVDRIPLGEPQRFYRVTALE
jgi:hypothetical protein